MSEVRLNILDAHGAMHGNVHGSLMDSIVAALGAEPETIDELEAALSRYDKRSDEQGAFARFAQGTREEPWDAGLVVIDLAARVAAWDSTYSDFCRQGQVDYRADERENDFAIPYETPDDWVVVRPPLDWQGLAERRRAERAAATFDEREILYDKLAAWIANEYASHRDQDDASAIHARWLLTPRDDLQGASPRDCLLARHNYINLDLQWRAMEWSFLGHCPPGLSPEAHAYRFGGFGTHEIVLYYELIRHLLEICHSQAAIANNNMSDYLAAAQQQWLHSTQADLHGLSPFLVIGYERARLPLTVPAREVFDDDDCPVCKDMLELSGPCFWHLDGCNMDNEFAFSFHATQKEWQDEQDEWDRMSDEFGRA